VKKYFLVTGLLMVFALISVPVFAVLGGSEASVQTDQIQLKARLQSTQAQNYTVHELRAPTGVVIREYAAGGTIFGVAWEGAWPPDMHQLLGSYFDEYMQEREQQARNGPPGRRPVRVELPGLVVNIAGHPGYFRGQAFVPSMLPSGVAGKDIR
jgi:hypothetical protein